MDEKRITRTRVGCMAQSYRISVPASLSSRAMRLIDTHTHLYQPAVDNDRDAAMNRCAEAGVDMLLLPNIDRESIPRVREMMERWPDRCRGMMGLHPCHVKDDYQAELDAIGAELREGLSSGERPYVAVGEIGFDLHWDKTTLDLQRDAFRQQVEWANALDLPIVIHVRDAFDALFEALDEVYSPGLRGVVHCFTGGRAEAERVLQFDGFYLGIGGVATYKNGGLDQVLPHVPHDRVILETDSPYLSPVPHRGKRNESAYTAIVARRVADLWEVPLADCAEITTANAERLFRLHPTVEN
jgi:TatD DNase family protein